MSVSGVIGQSIYTPKNYNMTKHGKSIEHGEFPAIARWWFEICFIFFPGSLGKMNPFWRAYFSIGLNQTTN